MSEDQDLFGLPDDEAERQRLIDHVGEGIESSKWGKTLTEYVETLEALFLRRGFGEDRAFSLAADCVLELAEQRGGRVDYFPRGDALRTALKHAEIYRRGKRGNVDALAKEFDLSVPQVYRILREQYALHRDKIQGKLFSDQTGGAR